MNNDDDSVIVFGTPLEPLDDNELPSKRPIQLQDQKVYDENGLQRFHGAFTGGFSAGYFNTVGTKEGWTPSEFVSSRSQKAEKKMKRPEDFMDAEDLKEFGIAPMRVHTKERFRKDGDVSARSTENTPQIIPGISPLLDIVKPVTKSVGVVLLQKLGWRPGKGIGPKKKLLVDKEKVYGCALPSTSEQQGHGNDNSASVMVSPDDVSVVSYKIKTNVYGLDYVPLHDSEVFSVSAMLSQSVSGQIRTGSGKKKVAFRGQAFGVGAFEDDDEDIYGKDDFSRYDFSLDEEDKHLKQDKTKERKPGGSSFSFSDKRCLNGFVIPTEGSTFSKKHFPPPEIPPNYSPKSLFHSVPNTVAPSTGTGRFLNRFAFNIADRTKLLGNRFAVSSKSTDRSLSCTEDRSELIKDDNKCNVSTPEHVEKQPEKSECHLLKFPTILSTKFVSSTVLEQETTSYGLSRVAPAPSSTVPEIKPAIKEHKCQRLIEVWHPVTLLCKRFNVPDPFPDSKSETSLLACAVRRPTEKTSIFRSLFETSMTVPAPCIEPNSEIPTDVLPEEISDSKRSGPVADSDTPLKTIVIETEIKEEPNEPSSTLSVTEENFKPPTPPTMDLFKAIFQDTSSEDENAHSSGDEEVDSEIEKEHSGDEKIHSEKPEAGAKDCSKSKSDQPEELPTTSTTVTTTTVSSLVPQASAPPVSDCLLYGPALPPAGSVSATPLPPPIQTLVLEHKHKKRKTKKRKSHHKSHKKHKKKKSRHSKLSSDESPDESASDSPEDADEVDVHSRLVNRLKQMKKSR